MVLEQFLKRIFSANLICVLTALSAVMTSLFLRTSAHTIMAGDKGYLSERLLSLPKTPLIWSHREGAIRYLIAREKNCFARTTASSKPFSPRLTDSAFRTDPIAQPRALFFIFTAPSWPINSVALRLSRIGFAFSESGFFVSTLTLQIGARQLLVLDSPFPSF